MRILLLAILFFFPLSIFCQEAYVFSGNVIDDLSKQPIEGVNISMDGGGTATVTDETGNFQIILLEEGKNILVIEKLDYETQKIPIIADEAKIHLGTIALKKDIQKEKTDNLITLTEGDLAGDEESTSVSSGLLQATRDLYLTRAAFDFSQVFFKVRGYDSREGEVFINGIKMNKFFNGRPDWNNWGGLNDVIRNQEFYRGLEKTELAFGGILGNTAIDTRPSGLRKGKRFSASASNRTYAGRVMATYNSGLNNKGLGYVVSVSRRWAKEGYINGTLYDAYSFFTSAEYQLNEKNNLLLTAIVAKNRKGRSSALTKEVFELAGNQYNPYWGEQQGEIRNSRERDIFEPLFILNHAYTSEKFKWNSAIAYQLGRNARSRLGYYNAPNPDPTYYRYLPSFYINQSLGADFRNAALAEDGFKNKPQLNWQQLYTANTNSTNQGKAAYVLYNDVTKDKQFSCNSYGDIKLNDALSLNFGIAYQLLRSENYAEISDLLGAAYHEDIDSFSETRNDLNGAIQKGVNDLFSYHYNSTSSEFRTFLQMAIQQKRWNAFLTGQYGATSYLREGLFQNERYLENSLGEGLKQTFSNLGLKSGFTYFLSGRHIFKLHAAYLQRPPLLQNAYVNPRENNNVIPNISEETVFTADASYLFRLPNFSGRISVYKTSFSNQTDVNFFYVDSGLGSDFVQEVVTDIDKDHQGIEIGVAYKASSSVKLSLAAGIGNYEYANDPQVAINFDTAGDDNELINLEGSENLGKASIIGYKLPQGPQQAVAFGLEYRDPKYWWMGTTLNYLAKNYISIAKITRTESFYVDPETQNPFPEATPENIAKLLKQEQLPGVYLINLVGGKSWLIKEKYVSVFASVNNLFDNIFPTGGYEQSRNGNYGQLYNDNLSRNPRFGTKYWYGFGRTFFLNIAVSF